MNISACNQSLPPPNLSEHMTEFAKTTSKSGITNIEAKVHQFQTIANVLLLPVCRNGGIQ